MIKCDNPLDVANDQMLVMELRSKIHDAILYAHKLQNSQAIANSDSLLDDYIQKLDDTIADVIHPFERMLDAAESLNDDRTAA